MYNTPYFLIDENIKLFNLIVRDNELSSNSEEYNFNDVVRQIIDVDQAWSTYKSSLYQHSSPAFEENNRVQRIEKYIDANRTQFIDIADFSKKVQVINRLILDKNKYIISNIGRNIKIFSISHKFENIKPQLYYFGFQVVHEMDWYRAFVKQLKILYAIFNVPVIQELIRNSTLPYYVSLSTQQVYYLRLLYNFCEYYGHIVPVEQVEPHLFTAQYMEIYNARNNADLLSALSIVFMRLYDENGSFSNDASKYVDFEKIINKIGSFVLGNTHREILPSLLMMFPELLSFDTNGIQKMYYILQKWHPHPGPSGDATVGEYFKKYSMPDYKEQFDTVWFDNSYLRDLSLGNYSFFEYLGVFNAYHNNNVSYFSNPIYEYSNVLLKYDSSHLKILNTNSIFYANIKLNKYPNGLIKDEKYTKILNNNVFIYNNDFIDVFSYIDFNYTNNEAFSVSINEIESGHSVMLYESDKYFIKLIDDVISDKEFYKSSSKL